MLDLNPFETVYITKRNYQKIQIKDSTIQKTNLLKVGIKLKGVRNNAGHG